jgi:hypothetical protein
LSGSQRCRRRPIRTSSGRSSCSTPRRGTRTSRSPQGWTRAPRTWGGGGEDSTTSASRDSRTKRGRVGRAVFPPEQIAEVKAVACEPPAEGAPLSRRSTADVHRLVIERGSCDASQSTIVRWLREDAIRPWLYRSWIFPTDLAQALAFELAEPDAVLGVGDVEVEDGPDEREAAGLAGEATDDLGASFDFGERPFEQVCASPPAAVSGRVAQVHDERVEVVGEAFGGPRKPTSTRKSAWRSWATS